MFSRSLFVRNMGTETSEIAKALKDVLRRAESASQKRAQTLPQTKPRVVAVSKTKPVQMIVEAYQLGQRHFGENYVQELVEKSCHPEILEKCKDIKWHFIGHLQKNKINKVLGCNNLFLMETLDSEKLAHNLNNTWEKMEKAESLNVMVQVNTSQEASKSGCNPAQVCGLVKFVREKCPRLSFIGLMTIGAFDHDLTTGPNPDFQLMLRCRQEVCEQEQLRAEEVELSMGMSHDFEHAIEVGSTNVRIGSVIFGARNYAAKSPPQEAASGGASAVSTSGTNEAGS
ncbi:pyridoxal phosphate homeostasis protein-like [Liolophura sinensis]|uniref:pyridoxal phosphate homeostasis protein-like n=1 Tax=Liolophura sinensis TaxID=3198878 RepID=UPI003158C1C1